MADASVVVVVLEGAMVALAAAVVPSGAGGSVVAPPLPPPPLVGFLVGFLGGAFFGPALLFARAARETLALRDGDAFAAEARPVHPAGSPAECRVLPRC